MVVKLWPPVFGSLKWPPLVTDSRPDYYFNLDWLLRSLNTVLTGEAKFQFLHDKSAEDVQDGLKRATKHIDTSLNMIGGRLRLDHDQGILRTLRCARNGSLPRQTSRGN